MLLTITEFEFTSISKMWRCWWNTAVNVTVTSISCCLEELDPSIELVWRIQAFEVRCCRRLQNISYKDHVSSEAVHKIYRTQLSLCSRSQCIIISLPWRRSKIWYDHICWHDEESPAGDSERNKKKGDVTTTSQNGPDLWSRVTPWRQQKTGKGWNAIFAMPSTG